MCVCARWRAWLHARALRRFYKGFREAPDKVRNISHHFLHAEGLVIYCPSAAEGLETPRTQGDLIACPEMPLPANVSLQVSCNFPAELFSKWSEKVEWELLQRRINVSLTLVGGRKKEPGRQKPGPGGWERNCLHLKLAFFQMSSEVQHGTFVFFQIFKASHFSVLNGHRVLVTAGIIIF